MDSESTDTDTISTTANKRRHKTISRKTHFELRAALDSFYLRQTDLAAMCGVEKNQVWKWYHGIAPTPDYVWCILSALAGVKEWELRRKKWHSWSVARKHIFTGKFNYKELAKKYHPDLSRRDTTAEMQQINAFKD